MSDRLLAWPTLALFSKKKKSALGTLTPLDRTEFDKLNEQLRSMVSKVGYVGDDIHKVADRVDAVREGVQGRLGYGKYDGKSFEAWKRNISTSGRIYTLGKGLWSGSTTTTRVDRERSGDVFV